MLDHVQLEAVNHPSGAVCVAGPGAGKTLTLTHRLHRLIKLHGADRVLAITFSASAAEEMRVRTARLADVPKFYFKHSIRTFHSLSLGILKAEAAHLPFTLSSLPLEAQMSQARRLLKAVAGEDYQEAKRFIARERRGLVSPRMEFEEVLHLHSSLNDVRMAGYYADFDEQMQAAGLIDFDSMTFWATWLLDKPEIRTRWQKKFLHVLVDEAHDAAYADIRLAQTLAAPEGNLFVVGDRSQSIFSFRGACNDLLLARDGGKTFYLGTNYRSRPEIIDAFKGYAEQDALSQELVKAMRSASKLSGTVTYSEYVDAHDEARNVARLAGNDKDTAILGRTRAVLAIVANAFIEAGLPFQWRGNFWQTPEVKSCVAFMRLAHNQGDRQALRDAICSNAPIAKYLSTKFAEALDSEKHPLDCVTPKGTWKNYQINQWCKLAALIKDLAALRTAKPATVFSIVLSESGTVTTGDSGEPDDFKNENIDTLAALVKRFDTLAEFLAYTETARKDSHSGPTLSTIHRAKGLEFNRVFVVGVTEGILPHARSEDWEEERRLLYVALSRAKNELHVSWTAGKKSLLLGAEAIVQESQTDSKEVAAQEFSSLYPFEVQR